MPKTVFVVAKCAWETWQGKPDHHGPLGLQDWYRALKFAVDLVKSEEGSTILFVTNLSPNPGETELENYVTFAKQMGLRDSQIQAVFEGEETISQLDAAKRVAKTLPGRMVLVSTWTHYPRIAWMTRKEGCERYGVFGIPMIKPMIVDFIFTVAWPILEVLHLDNWLHKKIRERRVQGKL